MCHAFPSIARSRAGATHRCRGEDCRRHHHSGHREGKPQEGEVLAAGPGGRNEQGQLVALDVKPSDRVLFGKWSGTEVRIAGKELLIMKESDLLGVVEKTSATKKAA
jgi:co-chaperonin GroES (HSP10)